VDAVTLLPFETQNITSGDRQIHTLGHDCWPGIDRDSQRILDLWRIGSLFSRLLREIRALGVVSGNLVH
jgi:hypothetical protein